jgi:hypothetical protein
MGQPSEGTHTKQTREGMDTYKTVYGKLQKALSQDYPPISKY